MRSHATAKRAKGGDATGIVRGVTRDERTFWCGCFLGVLFGENIPPQSSRARATDERYV